MNKYLSLFFCIILLNCQSSNEKVFIPEQFVNSKNIYIGMNIDELKQIKNIAFDEYIGYYEECETMSLFNKIFYHSHNNILNEISLEKYVDSNNVDSAFKIIFKTLHDFVGKKFKIYESKSDILLKRPILVFPYTSNKYLVFYMITTDFLDPRGKEYNIMSVNINDDLYMLKLTKNYDTYIANLLIR